MLHAKPLAKAPTALSTLTLGTAGGKTAPGSSARASAHSSRPTSAAGAPTRVRGDRHVGESAVHPLSEVGSAALSEGTRSRSAVLILPRGLAVASTAKPARDSRANTWSRGVGVGGRGFGPRPPTRSRSAHKSLRISSAGSAPSLGSGPWRARESSSHLFPEMQARLNDFEAALVDKSNDEDKDSFEDNENEVKKEVGEGEGEVSADDNFEKDRSAQGKDVAEGEERGAWPL